MKYEVNKSTTINAPLEKVRTFVEDFNQWNRWSPWTIVEPDCSINVQGTPNTPGHSMHWEGDIIGAGKNTLVVTQPMQLNYDLVFLKPWKSKAKVSFQFEALEKTSAAKQVTQVTWSMTSSMPFFLFFMIKTMKNWIGMDYERGLRMLKELAEQDEIRCKTINNNIVDYQGFSYRGIKRTLPIAEMPGAMSKDFEKLVQDIVINGKKGAKHWLCIYPEYNFRSMQATYIAAVSDEDLTDLPLGSEYVQGQIPDARALEIKHEGAYEFLGNAWSMGMMNIRAKKLKQKGHPFEQYWNNPMEVPPEELKTSVYFPLKS